MSAPDSYAKDKNFHRFRTMMGQAIEHQQKGDYAAAENIFSQILSETPEQPDVLHYWGLLKHQTGKSSEAVKLMKKSLEIGLPNSGYFYNLGGVLQQSGQLLEALEYLQQATDLTPTHAGAWNRMGEINEDLDMSFKAETCYRNAYLQEPQVRQYATNLIRVLRQNGNFEEAISVCDTCLQAHPEDIELLLFQTRCLSETGQSAQAEEKLRSALRNEPLSAQLQHAMGLLMSENGDFEAARKYLQQAIAINPQYYAAYFTLSMIQDFSDETELVKGLESRVQQISPKDPVTRASAEFALGKMLDDQRQYDRAFTHFDLANKTARKFLRYSTAAQKIYMDGMIEHINRDFLTGHPKAGLDTEVPVFILGMMRSGTSLVEQILASHPQVAGGGELMYMPLSLRKYTESPTILSGDRIASLSDEDLRSIGSEYLSRINASFPGARRVTDKLPGNFIMTGLIRVLFPNARIIHCVRDPLDTCLSCYFTHFDAGHSYAYDLTEIGEYYRMYHRLMAHYEGLIGKDDILTIKYEDLLDDVEGNVRNMLDFCGLDWDPVCLDFHAASRSVKTSSLYQVRQTPYTRSMGRWKHYSSHVEPLRLALGDMIK